MAVLNIRGCSVSSKLLALLFTVAPLILGGQAEDYSSPAAILEYQIKAAFLYNFAKFVEWPAEKSGDDRRPILAGVIGRDPFGPTLDQTFNGKTVNGRALAIRRVAGLAELKRCHILFISSSEKSRLAEILSALGNASVLTVSEIDQFAELGGMINFTKEENKIRLEINVDIAAQAGIRISSKLLKLVRVVRTEVRDGRN